MSQANWRERVRYAELDNISEDTVISSASDALVYVQHDDRYLITSPNATFIPKLPIGRVNVHVNEDAKFGLYDPIHHPQLYWRDAPFLACIPRPPEQMSANDPNYMVWHFIEKTDVEEIQGTGGHVLKPSLLRSIAGAVSKILEQCGDVPHPLQRGPFNKFTNSLSDGLLRLQRPVPYTNLIQNVAFIQRHWLLLRGFLTFYVDLSDSVGPPSSNPRPVQRSLPLMGTFTNLIDVVESFQRKRIPVWYLRFHDQVYSSDYFVRETIQQPPGWWVRQTTGLFGWLAFKGTLGPDYLKWYALNSSMQYMDSDTTPLVLNELPNVDPASIVPLKAIQSSYQPSASPSSALVERPRYNHNKSYRKPHPCMYPVILRLLSVSLLCRPNRWQNPYFCKEGDC